MARFLASTGVRPRAPALTRFAICKVQQCHDSANYCTLNAVACRTSWDEGACKVFTRKRFSPPMNLGQVGTNALMSFDRQFRKPGLQ